MWEFTFPASPDVLRAATYLVSRNTALVFRYPLSVNKQHRYPPGSPGNRPDDPRQLQNGK
ncbi:hypothetical protein CCE08_20735 [Escherichia coli]|nr:hypothetical protein CCE08_20735 [Escherichia coli]